MRSPAVAVAPLIFALLACGSVATTSTAPAPTEPRSAEAVSTPSPGALPGSGKSIGRLRTRDHELTLFASATGTRVTVRTRDGLLVADRVDADTLRADHPELYQLVRSAIAADRGYLDATLDHRPSPEPRAGARDVR